MTNVVLHLDDPVSKTIAAVFLQENGEIVAIDGL
jgi:hypothetical protein